MCYFGALEAVFAGVRGVLEIGSVFVFTVEKLTDGDPFKLMSHGRYAHALDYLTDTLRSNDLELRSAQTRTLRKELGEGVQGWVVVAERI